MKTSHFIGNDIITLEEAMEQINDSKVVSLPSARIDDEYDDYIMMLFQMYKKSGVTLRDSCAAFNFYDGTIHANTEKKRTNIISFSSRLLSASCTNINAGGSKEILTWQQVLCEEKAECLFPTVHSIYRRITDMRGK